ncbi:MAG: hypothetical protein ACYCW6_19860 [Candidatus Xenobia bacterium]
MKTSADFAGYTHLKQVSMTAGSPNNDGMLPEQEPAFKDSYIGTKDMWGYPPAEAASMLKADSYRAAAQARESHTPALLVEDDFATPVQVKHFHCEQYGPVKFGGHGGYAFRDTRYVPDGSRSLTQFVREWSGYPNAVWALEVGGKDSMHPPYLHVFVPKTDELTALAEKGEKPDLGALLQGHVKAAETTAPGSIQDDGDEIVIGSLRLTPDAVLQFQVKTS